jgi:YgiT-type zinc finger domain-containing protein
MDSVSSAAHLGLKRMDMICDICRESGAEIRYLTRTRSYGKGASLLVIENVPIVVCPHCGESYVTAETLHEIERNKLHRRSLTKPRSVAVASFA